MTDPNPELPLTLGKRVIIFGKRKGTVRYIGDTEFGPGTWVGIELDKPTGSHDGGAQGKRYFTCPAGHGVYVQRHGVLSINSWQAAASQIQSLLRGRKDRQETEYKRAFQTWNQMEMGDESEYLNQTTSISRVESMLRAYHPSTTATPNANSAVNLSQTAGVSIKWEDWGENVEVEAGYAGPHLKFPLTLANVEEVLHHIRTKPGVVLHRKYLMQLLGQSVGLFNKLVKTSVYDMDVPPGSEGKLVICGDTHGQLADFLWVLKQNGEPSVQTAYLLNGDIADRGEDAVEIFVITLMYKMLYPARVSINRGNHENLEMNRRSLDHGGGFFDEVQGKYDASVFMMFQQLFEVLPLATVVSKRVFVVHGGLFRRDGVLVQHLRSINRRRQCPTNTEAIEDALLFDCMWADPQDFPGVSRAAHRGANCIRFGPDVTKRFLGNNSLSLCIRSHEVPNSLRGFEDRHDGRLITVFTASNYCGQTGNYGAVVIFHSDMSYTVEEHMAPTLESLVQEYTSGVPSGDQESETAEQDMTMHGDHMEKHAKIMQDDMISKLKIKVAQCVDDLWWYWTQVDTTGSGKVPTAHWRQGMASALQLDLPWFNLQKTLVVVDAEGMVNYVDFLKKFKPEWNIPKMENGWDTQIVKNVYEALLSKDLTLKELTALFDQDGDGLVSPQEFKQALISSGVGLPETQINALLRAIDRDASGKLEVNKFLDRFQVVYSSAGGEVIPEKIAKNLHIIGRHLVGTRDRGEVFKSMDKDGNGFVEKDEFCEAIGQMKLPNLAAEDIMEMWSAIDVNDDGHLNYLEFCAAFQVVDSGDGQKVIEEIVGAIIATFQKNKTPLAFAFRYFDPTGTGSVKKADFSAGLAALVATAEGSSPITRDQMDLFVNYMDTDGDGNIDYQEFLNMFSGKNKDGTPASATTFVP
mmetsp:Transcript_4543/g.10913  ORF Transcript_4543/g.10913 Transcript_4543/m.10913 type:complete len:919 (+) Transcript_4543:74-2830(+)